MPERESEIWTCQVCIHQMFGGERCAAHNPSPEERDHRANVSRAFQSQADVSQPRPDERPQEEPAYAF